MFLNNSSITRPPPSLLPGSDGTRSPSFNWYYETATTTGRFLRHSVCSVAPQYLGSISSFRSSSRGNRRANARMLFDRSHPLFFRCFVPRTPSVLPSSLQTPRAFALFSDSGRASTPGYRGVSVLSSLSKKAKTPATHHFRSSITRLLHWLFTLRAVLSDDDAKLASGG